MPQDAQGNALTIASDEAALAFDQVVDAFLRQRFDAGARLKTCITLDPEAPLSQAMGGLLATLAFNQGMMGRAESALVRASALPANPRETAHLAALRALTEGRPDAAMTIWEQILADHPRDLLAFRLHHFQAFWTGQPERMLRAVEGVLPHWSEDVTGWGAILACRCFANEECGSYTIAEHAGRAAVALDPTDLWGTHGVAHVLEMQGRRTEGLTWLTAQERHWEGGNNLMHHLWWHQAMFHIERGEFDAILSLYDRRFRDFASPVTLAMPDLYIDVQNAASMLWRLERQGVPVGDRWTELADKAEARIGDTLSAFTLPHWMMALAATGRDEAAQRMLQGVEAAGRGNTMHATILREAALPACVAVLAHSQGRFADAASALRPALGGLYRLGGSHAQRDVLEQLFLDAAMKAGLQDDVVLLLERAASHPVPAERRIGYAEAARSLRH